MIRDFWKTDLYLQEILQIKLWNASRFVMMNVKGEDNSFLPMTDIKLSLERNLLKSEDKWIISRINEAVKDIKYPAVAFELY